MSLMQYTSLMQALLCDQLCHTDIFSKHVTRDTNAEYDSSPGSTDSASKRETHDTHTWLRTRGINLVALILPQPMQNTTRKLDAGTPAEPTLSHWTRPTVCTTQDKSSMRELLWKHLCYTDIASKHYSPFQKLNAGTPAKPTLLHCYCLKVSKTQYKSSMWPTPL